MPSIHDRIIWHHEEYPTPLAAIVTGVTGSTIHIFVMPPSGDAFWATTTTQGTGHGQYEPFE